MFEPNGSTIKLANVFASTIILLSLCHHLSALSLLRQAAVSDRLKCGTARDYNQLPPSSSTTTAKNTYQ
jgi:hypothetical protein